MGVVISGDHAEKGGKMEKKDKEILKLCNKRLHLELDFSLGWENLTRKDPERRKLWQGKVLRKG